MGRVLPFVACVLVTSVASATVLVPAELREIVAGSEVIAYARVIDVRAEWADGRRWIDTVVTADVVSYLKGGSDVTEPITFKVPGGRLGRYRSVFVGAPVFQRGDEAVVFLKPHGDDLPDLFGLNQGVFRVRVDEMTGQRIVVPPVMAKAPSDTPEKVTRGALDRKPLPFAEFGARVREAMAATSKAAR
jgi:hypothetical protein